MTLKKLKKENKDKIQTNIMNLIFKKMKMSCHKNKKTIFYIILMNLNMR